MHQIFMRGEHFKENRIILRIQDFMLTMTSYSASNDMFMLFQLITTELSYLRYSSDHLTMVFYQYCLRSLPGLIMKIIKDLIIHKKKRRLRL